MTRFKSILLTAVFCLGVQVGAQGNIRDLFEFTLDNTNGGCGYVGEENLQRIIDDAFRAMEAGEDVVDSYSTNDRAARLVEAFFNSDGPGLDLQERDAIAGEYRRMVQWLTLGGPTNDGQLRGRPWLHCDDDFHIRQSVIDPARERDGSIVRDANDNEMAIYQIPQYMDQRLEAARRERLSSTDIYPYWSQLHGTYFWTRSYGQGPNDGPCSLPRLRGYTFHLSDYSVVVLCPHAFGLTSETKTTDGWAYTPLERDTVPPHTRAREVRYGSIEGIARLNDRVPTAHTMMHELFHLQERMDYFRPIQGEVMELSQLFNQLEELIEEHESFVLMSMAAAEEAAENIERGLEWFTGWATRN